MLSSLLLATSLALFSLLLEFPAVAQVQHQSLTTQQFLLSKELVRQQFSVNYPDHWIVTSDNQDNVGYWIISNQPLESESSNWPPFLIKTTLSFEDFSIPALLRLKQETEKRFGSEYEYASMEYKRESLTIGDRPALRTWERRNLEPAHRIVTTYISSSDGMTLIAASTYTTQNRAAESTILGVHNSIKTFR